MNGENDRQLVVNFFEGAKEPVQGISVVHVGGSVKGEQPVGPRLQSQILKGIELAGPFKVLEKSIDHDVSDPVNSFGLRALAQKISISVGFGGEEPG